MHEPPNDTTTNVIPIRRNPTTAHSSPSPRPQRASGFREYIEEVRRRADILEVIGADVELKKCGSHYKGLSPFNEEKTPSFIVYPDSGRFVDYSGGGGHSGSVIDYVMRRHGLSFVEAVHRLAERYGVMRPHQTEAELKRALDELTERREVERVLGLAMAYYQRALPRTIREEWFHKRYGFNDETIEKFQLGWADGKLFEHLTGELGLARELALKTGLFIVAGSRVQDFYLNRLVFPYLRAGRVVYSAARSTSDECTRPWDKAKYLKQLTHSEKHPYVSPLVRNDVLFNEDGARAARTLLITEGIADAISASQAGVTCISTATTQSSKRLEPRLVEIAERMQRVIICNDSEENNAGEKGALGTAHVLLDAGVDVRIAKIPRAKDVAKIDVNDLVRQQGPEALARVIEAAKPLGEFLLDQIPYQVHGADLDDALKPVFNAMAKVSEIERAAMTTAVVKRYGLGKRIIQRQLKSLERATRKPTNSELPTVLCSGRSQRELIADVVAALVPANDQRIEEGAVDLLPPPLFRSSTGLSVLRSMDGAAPRLETCSDAMMWGTLVRTVHTVRLTEEGERPCSPPKDVCRDVIALCPESIPPLEAVITTPVFDAGARILDTPGYHSSARVWLHLSSELSLAPVPPIPNASEVAEALELIMNDLLVDFPFASEADRAHMLALILLPFIRMLIRGGTPLFVIEAAAIAAGKSLLAQLACTIATGKPGGMAVLPTDEDEVQKTLTSELLQAKPYVVFDNMREHKAADSTSLASVLTSDEWRARLLGKNEVITLPNRSAWVITGNNIQLSPELARRAIRIRLSPNCDRAWQRTGFKHSSIKSWAQEHRGALVHAALVLIQSWVAAGTPLSKTTLGSFESWAQVTGGILDVVGVPGFLANAEELYANADTESEGWRAFIEAWWHLFGATPQQVAALNELCEQRSLLEEVRTSNGSRSQQTRLGLALQSRRDRVYGQYRIRVVNEARNNRRYALEYVPLQQPSGPTDASASSTSATGASVEPASDEVNPFDSGDSVAEFDPWAD